MALEHCAGLKELRLEKLGEGSILAPSLGSVNRAGREA